MTVPGGSPLNYPVGSQPPIRRVTQNRAPTSNDNKNFREGDEWLDTNAMDWYKLVDITGNVATWVLIGGVSGTVKWNVETGTSAQIVINTGTFADNAGGVTLTLPLTFDVGDVVEVAAINAGGWTLAQNAGQNIQFGNQVTTTGVGGSISSTEIGDGLQLICSVQDTTFVVTHSMGNMTVT